MTAGSDPLFDIAGDWMSGSDPTDRSPPMPSRGTRVMAIAVCGNLPGMAGIWLVQYANRLSQKGGPVGLIRFDGSRYCGEVLGAQGRSLPSDSTGWLDRAGGFVRQWIIAAPERTRPEELAAIRDADIVLLTGSDEAASAAAHQKLGELAGAARAIGVRPRTVSVVVLGAGKTAATVLVNRLAGWAEDELDTLVVFGGSMQQIGLIETTGPVALPDFSGTSLGEVTQRIEGAMLRAMDRLDAVSNTNQVDFSEFGQQSQSSTRIHPTMASVDALGVAQSRVPLQGDKIATTMADESPIPVRRTPIEDFGISPSPAPIPVGQSASMRPRQVAPVSVAHEGSSESLASLFDELVLLAPRAAGAASVEFASDLAGRLHLLSADASTRDLRIASAWARANWLLMATACRELRGGTRAAIVEHLIVDTAKDAVALHRCGLLLHLRHRTASGVSRVDLNDESTAAAV
ncbi:MAG: hypothetical protein O2800_04435 [Planctomycetota bacterium]|nr:hypothetical protein [Planctomycetota bacterium]